MPKRRKTILSPLFVDGGANNDGGGGGNGAHGNVPGTGGQQPFVAPGSAAASAQSQQSGDNGQTGQQGQGDAKPAGYVPVGELATERQKRHELEAKVKTLETSQNQQLEAFKAALGLKPEQTPADVQAQLKTQQDEHRAAMTALTVHQLASAAGADPAKLLDSNSFLHSIQDVQPGDHAAINAAITKALEGNSTLKAGAPAGAGSRDAAQGGGAGGNKPSISDLIRKAAGY